MIALTYFPSLRNARGTRKATTWPKLCSWLSRPVISPVKDDTAGFSVATYADDRRALANVEQVFCLGIDLDHLDALSVHTKRGADVDAPDWTSLRAAFNSRAAFVYTTWSSTLDLPRLRVLMLLSRPVTGDEYRRVYQAVVGKLEREGFVVDRNASDPSRFWFRPAIRAEGCSFVFWTCTGAPLDVEAALAAVPPAPAPPPPSPRPPLAKGGPSVFERARAYLAKCDPAIQGSGGRTTTFLTAQRLVRGFALSNEDAFTLMSEWNQRCRPPWSDRDLRIKIEEAATKGRFADGDMLERQR